MKRFHLLVILCVFPVILSGCGLKKLRPEVGSKLRSGNVATMFYMETKKIKYEEMVYKVLWNEERKQDATFTGFWDIDKDLSEKYSEALVGYGIKSRPVQQLLPDKSDYNALESCIAGTRKEDGMNRPLQLSPELSHKLRDMGLDFLVVIRSAYFYGKATSMFSFLSVNVPSIIIVYDINDDKEEYSELFYVGGGNIAYDKSPREIENNGLKMLKEATYKWLQTSTQKRLPEALSLMSGS